MTKKRRKTHELRLVFDSKESAKNFRADWLDGGLDGGGTIDWETTSCNKACTRMRIKGTGWGVDWVGDERIIMTPENQQKKMDKAMKKYCPAEPV